jgi:hypothetical protein
VLVGADMLAPFQAVGNALPFLHEEGTVAQVAGALLFFALAVVLAKFAQRKV